MYSGAVPVRFGITLAGIQLSFSLFRYMGHYRFHGPVTCAGSGGFAIRLYTIEFILV